MTHSSPTSRFLQAVTPNSGLSSAAGAESSLFSSIFTGSASGAHPWAPWDARLVEVGAQRLQDPKAGTLLQNLWASHGYMAALDAEAVQTMMGFFELCRIPEGRDLLREDETGDFLAVLLKGEMSVNRITTWGERQHLAAVSPGGIMGESSLLDGGPRHSTCTTVSTCEIAILTAANMDEMMTREPRLAAVLITLLVRKLSQRLRVVGSNLGALDG